MEKIIAQNKVGGTYIFNGPDNLGKTTLAVHFAQTLLCANKPKGSGKMPCGLCPACLSFARIQSPDEDTAGEQVDIGSAHGDFHIVKKDKDKKYIAVEQVRDFIRTLCMSSFANSYKIGIIKHADRLNPESSNALLKTLEEPRRDTVVILIAQDAESLPKTIASRSQILNFFPVKPEIVYDYLLSKQASRNDARDLSRLSLGRPALAVKFLEDPEFRESFIAKARVFLDFARQDTVERFAAIDGLFGKKTTGQELVVRAVRVLEIWEGVARDLLLSEYGFNNLLQHNYMEKDIMETRPSFNVRRLVSLVGSLKEGREQLNANVNPKLVLENIALAV